MISEDTVEDIGSVIKEIMRVEGVNKYTYEIEGKSECGNNNISEVIFVKVKCDEDRVHLFNLVIKTANRSAQIREKLPVELLNNREVFMYSEVFPNFAKLISDNNYKVKFDFVPQMYWMDRTKGRETIVLENLKSKGFKLHDSQQPWNLQHSLLTMEHYGKLHALSMALKDQKPDLFERLRRNLGSLAQEWTTKLDMREVYRESFAHALDLLRKSKRGDLAEKYIVLLDEIEDLFNNKTEKDDTTVICHMDCWNNNFMFKYENEDESRPSEVSFLDFQVSLIDSPAKDLSYNIYTTCDNTCLANFDELLETYHCSLTLNLQSLGSNSQKFFSMEDLRRHWRKYGIYGIFISMNLIKKQLLNKDDAPPLEESVKDDHMIHSKMSYQDEYDRRILEVFLHFGDNFL